MWKIVLLVALTLSAAGLLYARVRMMEPPVGPDAIAAAVAGVLHDQNIPATAIRSWSVHPEGSRFTRRMQRVSVPRDFVTVTFTHELALRMRPLGVYVVGTERTKEASVTMHIVAGGHTVHSITLVSEGY